MLSNITIGQYFPTGSCIHRLDPCTKLLLTLALIVITFLASNVISLTLCIAFVFTVMAMSRVGMSMYFRMLKAIWPIVLFTSILNAIYVSGDTIISFWIINITRQGVQRAVFMAIRICLLIFESSLLTYTTSPTEITDGIERLLKPLRLIGLEEGVHVLAMMMSISLRFIPTLLEETDKIMSAQKARGADLDTGGLIKRIRAILPILIPLLISASRRAIELAQAMESRCYNGGRGRTKLKQPKLGKNDGVAFAISAVFCAAVIGLRFVNLPF